MSDPAAHLSWSVGPADARTIRVLFYLAEGLLGGSVAAVLFVGTEETLSPSFPGGPIAPGLLAVFALLVLGRIVWFYAVARAVRDRGRQPNPYNSALAAWTRDQQWRWPAAVGLVVAAGLVALVPDEPGALSEHPVWFGTLLLAVGCSALGELLSSEGRIDIDSLTLTTPRYHEWREVDLRTLSSVRRTSAGGFTVLWLSVAPGVEKRTTVQGFYAMPTEIAERARPAFEEGLTADPPIDPETAERARFFRRVNRVVLGGGLLLAVVALLGLAWLGTPVWNLFTFAWLVIGGGLFALKLAA